MPRMTNTTGLRPILVVDDDPDIRTCIRDLLTDAGYSAAEAEDGVEALAVLRTNPTPCMVLLDMMMPRMDGAATLAEIKRDEALAALPVIVVSASKIGAPVGAAAFLPKPFKAEQLMSLVRKYCAPHAA